MSLDQGPDVSLKDVLQSKPKGSFLFPANVVVEDVLEHLDETWTTLWEGGLAKSGGDISDGNTSETSTHRVTDPPKKLSWLNRTLSRLSLWSKKESKQLVDRVFSIDRIHSFIPRFPSWVQWNDEEGRCSTTMEESSIKS